MKIVCKSILIVRDPMTKTAKLVKPWEVPAYRSKFGDEAVIISGNDVEVEVDELPDAEEESSRLRQLFGVEDETKQSHIDIVYGRGQAGIKALEAAMKASVAGDVEKAQAASDKSQGFKPNEVVKEVRENAHVDDPLADDGSKKK